MDQIVNEIIDLLQATPGRRIVSLRQVEDDARALNLPQIVARCGEAIKHEMRTRALETLWLGERNNRKVHAPETSEHAAMANRLLTGIREGAQLVALGADPTTMAEVDDFLKEVFPAGVQVVTSMPYPEESAEIERLLVALQGPLAATVASFGLTRLVERLAAVSERFRNALYSETRLDFATVRAAREQGHTYVLEIVSMILGAFPLHTPEHTEKRNRLLRPILEMDAAVRAYRRSRRSVPDVDPMSGEIELPADPDDGSEVEAVDEPQASAPAKGQLA